MPKPNQVFDHEIDIPAGLPFISDPAYQKTYPELQIIQRLNAQIIPWGHKAYFDVVTDITPASVETIDWSTVTSCSLKEYNVCSCDENGYIVVEPNKKANCSIPFTACYSQISAKNPNMTPEQEAQRRASRLKKSIELGVVEDVVKTIVDKAVVGTGGFVVGTTIADYENNVAQMEAIEAEFVATHSQKTWSPTNSILEADGSLPARLVYIDTKYFNAIRKGKEMGQGCCNPALTILDGEMESMRFGSMLVIAIDGLEDKYGVQALAMNPSKVMFVGMCPSNSNNFGATTRIVDTNTPVLDANGKPTKLVSGQFFTAEANFDVMVYDNALSVVKYVSATPAAKVSTTA